MNPSPDGEASRFAPTCWAAPESAGEPRALTPAPSAPGASRSFGLAVGTVVDGTYRVVDRLGQGGMGVVMLAYDERLERSVALKLIRPELLDNTAFQERFLAEARAMARVHHPNVLPIYAFGEFEGVPYFVSELVSGQTVEQWLRSRPAGSAPDLDLAFRILDGTCLGVAAIHAASTVHRDLKPSNLLLDDNFHVRVADMGVADLLRRAGTQVAPELVGTPEYMAPENVLQTDVPAELVHRADVYSLGCLAFELLTGSPPYAAETSLQRMLAHVTAEVPRVSERRPDLPVELDLVLLRALAKDPRDRTPTVEAFRRALLAAREKTSEPVRILVAEDDEDFCQLLKVTLLREFPDAIVEAVGDGRAALEAFDRNPHSVVILDLGLPNLDGMQLTERLRAREGSETVPIIVLTGSGGPSEWKRLSSLGADGFLVKPVNLKDVVTLVRRSLVDRSRSMPPPIPT